MAVVYIIQLDLHEIPFEFIVAWEHIIKSFNIAMIREAEISYSAGFTLLKKEIENAAVEESLVKGTYTASKAHNVQQVIVDIIGL